MNPLARALKAKGPRTLLKRVQTISQRYGLTPSKMDRALAQFAAVLQEFECSATFPITAVALERNGRVIEKYQRLGIEFAVHGYSHIDYSKLTLEEQANHLALSRRVFREQGIEFSGFRCPYLRWNKETLEALDQHGFSYDSTQALSWNVSNGSTTPAYERVLEFYRARSAADYPALPRLEGELVRIPYCVPDDEAIVERLALESPEEGSILWQNMLQQTYDLGELFTLGLHPERTAACLKPLLDTLAAARSLQPTVWIARLNDIAAWWRSLAKATAKVRQVDAERLHIKVDGPPGLTVLVRGAEVSAPSVPWTDGYRQVYATDFTVRAPTRPFICVHPNSSSRLVDFLRQQGYLVEEKSDNQSHTVCLDQRELAEQDERPLLAQLKTERGPLIQFGRWPEGAQSALSITGDIDSLTLWDYGLRFLGR